ncbi:hypothetical protein ACGFIK_25125 [Micromonospora sp. NPDC048871]|uniref:hypothetical protein n=1 Tax=Micromonospora sp. NPDC048871 TaxID=3364259 RepID=UPI003719F33D
MSTVDCDDCGGLGFRVRRCQCTWGGDRLIVDGGEYRDEAYADCRLCGGDGSVAEPCHRCGRGGRRRAELVVTVVNLDTGAAASRRLVPGRLDPPTGRERARRAGELVGGLCATVGVRGLRPRWGRRDLDDTLFWLPPQWRPELPERQRWALEAEALARHDHDPWWIFVGRGSATPSPPDPAVELSRLCGLADLLHLDLVVEARRRSYDGVGWELRYELPGSPVPLDSHGRARDLPSAIADTDFRAAMCGLDERGRRAPLYSVRAVPPVGVPPIMDLDRFGRAVLAELVGDAPGAQAIWRDGRWWHTALLPTGSVESLHERETGQIVRHVVETLRRAGEPPDPAWWGEPIAHRPCPDCRPGSRLRRCNCRLGTSAPDPDCPDCSGAGLAPSVGCCSTCRDSGRIPAAVSVTVTDLRQVSHETWRPDGSEPAPVVAHQPNGKPVHQLGAHRRLARYASSFGVRPADLTRLDTDWPVDHDLLDGIVTVHEPGVDPVRQHVEQLAAGLPGARLFVLAAVPDAPPLTDLLRLAHALDLAAVLTYCDHRLDAGDPRKIQGERWDVRLIARDAPVGAEFPFCASVEAAVARCVEYLDCHLVASVPRDPDQPVPAPQAAPSPPLPDPTELLRRVGWHYAGQPVVAAFDRTGCRLWLTGEDTLQPLARAATLDDAVFALRL